MTRVVEERHAGEPWLLWRLGNATAIDAGKVRTLAIAWLFKEGGCWRLKPRLCPATSLFYNAVFFVRLNCPLGVFFSVRWAGESKRAFLQTGFGWKLNGRFGLLFRVSSDAAAAAGVTGPNYGQAKGFDFGTH